MSKKVFYALAAFLMLAANFAGPVQVLAEGVVEDTVEEVAPEAAEEAMPEFESLDSQYILSTDQRSFMMGAWLDELPEGLVYVVEDTSVAKVVAEQYMDDGIVFTRGYLQGVKAGETKIKIMYGEYVLDEAPVMVYSIETNLRSTQEVGTSQTFRFDTAGDITVVGVYMWANDEKGVVALTDNEDGTYTLTAKDFPTYTRSGGEVTKDTLIELNVMIGSNDGFFYRSIEYPVVLYAMAAEDAAGGAVNADEAATNESILRKYVAEALEQVFG